MAGNVVTNFIKNHIAVLVSCNDNLCRAMTQLLIDNAWKYLSYSLMEAKIFILSFNVEINTYRLQQVDRYWDTFSTFYMGASGNK